jgi:hypothetical protein
VNPLQQELPDEHQLIDEFSQTLMNLNEVFLTARRVAVTPVRLFGNDFSGKFHPHTGQSNREKNKFAQ